MNKKGRDEIRELLALPPAPEPPTGLLERIRADIPDDLAAATPPARPGSRRVSGPLLTAAASIAVLGLALVLASRVARQVPAPGAPTEDAGASAPAAVLDQTAPPAAAVPGETLADATAAPEAAIAAAAPAPESRPLPAFGNEGRPAPRAGSAAREGAAARRAVAPAPATGGTTERDDELRGDLYIRDRGTGPFLDTGDDPRSAFGLDVATGSYDRVRVHLARGTLPPPAAVRVEEWVNAFDYGDRPPRRGDFAVGAEGAPSPFAPAASYRLLRLAIRARDPGDLDGAPAVAVVRGARAEVEFEPAAVIRYRLLGHHDGDAPGARFRDGAPEAGAPEAGEVGAEVGAGHSVTALYEVELAPGIEPGDRLATLRLRWESVREARTVETAHEVRLRELAPRWEEASSALRLAAVVAEFAEILSGSDWARGADLGDLARRAATLAAELPQRGEVAELADLVDRAARAEAGLPRPLGDGGD